MENHKCINIIYFDGFDNPIEISRNLNTFKTKTNGAFIFIRTIDEFLSIMNKIKNKLKNNLKKDIFFHLIVSGKDSEKALKAIDENGIKKNFKKICIYCGKPEVYIDKYKNNDYIGKNNITKKRLDVIRFIENNKSEEISSLKEEFRV